MSLNQTAKMKLHIAHLSSKETLDVYRAFKRRLPVPKPARITCFSPKPTWNG
ncbi:MAG: hypothetical protein R3E39_26200 [Anaerolineae bacterium]